MKRMIHMPKKRSDNPRMQTSMTLAPDVVAILNAQPNKSAFIDEAIRAHAAKVAPEIVVQFGEVVEQKLQQVLTEFFDNNRSVRRDG